MQTIFYANTRFETDDSVAVAVLDYAESLAVDGSCAVVRIPTVSEGMPATSRLLVGAGLPVAVQASSRVDRVDGYDADVDPFEARRTLHDISERMGRLRQKVVARSFSLDTTLHEIWELSFEDVIGEPTSGSTTASPADTATAERSTTAAARWQGTDDNVTPITAAYTERSGFDSDSDDAEESREESGDAEL
ncbi:hypothetical protein ELQ90_00105 [Labedella phragmitis]|uniref:Uncharacterized protein n=1 Tax=Labedella phragmitis TaxID=2498849 RepID=A0A444PX55_9MICO|nr:hypothetical protein [Labedella phragmitis]RWZ52407.1 hypothetical protein ELQ90_00105 [Labedella phragmitis]